MQCTQCVHLSGNTAFKLGRNMNSWWVINILEQKMKVVMSTYCLLLVFFCDIETCTCHFSVQLCHVYWYLICIMSQRQILISFLVMCCRPVPGQLFDVQEYFLEDVLKWWVRWDIAAAVLFTVILFVCSHLHYSSAWWLRNNRCQKSVLHAHTC